jgi:flavin-dependent dehydrogenase
MPEAPFIAVGGGLAGAAFALELARNGAPVLLIESTRSPHHKVCGEFLSEEAQTLLSYLGIDVHTIGASSMGTFRLAAGEHCAEAPLPFLAAGYSRYRLDQALLDKAAEAGADIRRGVTVNEVSESAASLAVKAGGKKLEARGLALAGGKHNLRQFPRAPSDMVGFKLQLHVSAAALRQLDDVVQLMMFDGGYMGAIIVEEEIVTLCWVLHSDLLQQIGADWQSQAAFFARQSPLFAALLDGAKPRWSKPVAVAAIPYGYLRREPISPAIFPVGDQLAVIPSFTGDGMSIALLSGIAAAQAVLAGESADVFQRRMIARLAPQFRWASFVNVLFETKRLHPLTIGTAKILPRLVTWLAQSTRLATYADVIAFQAGPSGSDSGMESVARSRHV